MLEKFTVIDLIKTRSASVATITGNIVKFNNQTATELRFTPYIQFLINAKDKQFAIRGCKEDAPNAVKFSKPAGVQKNQISVHSAVIVDLIRKMGNWNAEDNWNVPGVYFADENALVYDLNAAYSPVARGGWTARNQKEAAEAAAINSLRDTASQQKEKPKDTEVTEC